MTDTLDLSLRIISAQAQLTRRFTSEMGAVHGLGLSDFVILLHLSEAPGGRLRRVDLADRLALSQSGVTRALLPLEKVGLIRRETDDRDGRVAYAAITPVGRQRVDEAQATATRISEEVFGDVWSAADAEQVARLLERLGAMGRPRPAEARAR
jgi:DNA-binding MarR family transcriptional regulator